MSKPTREEINRELAERRGSKPKRRDPFYPPDFARQDDEDEQEEDENREYSSIDKSEARNE